jgi:hypothetical protein
MTVLSNVIASALSDGTRLSQAESLWVRAVGSESVEYVKYGSAVYQNGAGVVSTHAVGTQDREITLELIDSYDGGNSGGMKFFLAYGAASNIDGLYLFHDGTSWRLRRFISYLVTISDAAFSQGNVRRKVVIRSESGNVTLSVYDATDSLIGSQTATNALDAYTGALPACVYDGGSWSVGDAVNQDGIGYISIKIDDLQSGGGGSATASLASTVGGVSLSSTASATTPLAAVADFAGTVGGLSLEASAQASSLPVATASLSATIGGVSLSSAATAEEPLEAVADLAATIGGVFLVSGVRGSAPADASVEAIWAYEIIPGISAATMLRELWQLAGLDASSPMTVTKSARTAGDIALTISGDGIKTSTVARQ